MGKAQIREHLEAISRVGLNFKKNVLIVRRGQVEFERNEYNRIALDEEFRDLYGRPDDGAAQVRVKEFLWHHAKMLYNELVAEIETRRKKGARIPEGLYELDKYDLEEYFDESDFNNFYKAYYRILHNLRLLGLDVAHDQLFKSTVLTHEGIPLGSKYVAADKVDEMFDQMAGYLPQSRKDQDG